MVVHVGGDYCDGNGVENGIKDMGGHVLCWRYSFVVVSIVMGGSCLLKKSGGTKSLYKSQSFCIVVWCLLS